MQARAAKAICVGNIKGGVGKSTLAIYLADFLRHRFKRRSIMMLDTDPQGTAFEIFTDTHIHNEMANTGKRVITEDHKKRP